MAVNKVVINHDGVENVLVDITDSTVTPDDMPEGVVAYDKSGEKITGNMSRIQGEPIVAEGWYAYENNGEKYAVSASSIDERKYVDANSVISMATPLRWFGDASPDDVMASASFTSTEGFGIAGNLWWLNEVALLDTTAAPAIEGGEKCVMLYGYAQEKGVLEVGNMIRLYHPTSNFGDANKNEVMRGKIFTSAEGFRLTGTGGKDVVFLYDPSFLSIPESPGSVRVAVNVDADGLMLLPNATVNIDFSRNLLGNANPEDVLAGKTFSSAAGIQCVGTFEPGPGEIEVTDDGNGNLTIINAVVTDNNGAITVTM